MGWAFPELRKVIEMKYGKGLPEKSRVPGRYPVYGSNGIIGLHEAAVTHGSTIIVGRKGSIGEIHLSSTACWPIDTTYYIDDFHGQPKEFFVYLLKHLNLGSYNRATAIPGLTREEAYGISIPLPPLNEQRRIVAKLDSLFTRSRRAREELGRVSGLVQRYKQAVLAAACSGRLTADWREQNPDVEPVSELLRKIDANRKLRHIKTLRNQSIDDSSLPELPPFWSWSKLRDIGELSRGKSKHRPRNDPKLFGGEYPFIQTGDIARSNGWITKHTQTYSEIGLTQSRLFPINTLCITIAANIADTAILTYPACFPDSVVGFIPEEGMFEILFAMYYLKVAQNNLESFAPATAQKNINLEILNDLAVPIPPLSEQKEIVQRVEKLFKAIDLIEQEHQKASQLLDRLEQATLAKAFRGELVPQDPNDEPAAALLERIQAERQARPQGKAVKSKQSRGERR